MLYYSRIDLGKRIDLTESKKVNSEWFTTIGILMMGLNFKIQFVMVAMICWCDLSKLVILLISLLFMVSGNLMEFIY